MVSLRRVPWVAMAGSHALAGGDHCVQVSQDRGSDDGLGLCGREFVGLTGGEVSVAGGVDGVGLQRSPDRAPGGQPELRAALAGELGRGR